MMDIDRQNLLQRLRGAGLRPTIPRIAVLQVFEDAGGQALSVEEVFHRICLRGLHASLGTIYRVAQQMSKHGLLEPLRAGGRKQLFRLRACEAQERLHEARLWAVNRLSGERASLEDDELRDRLVEALVHSGLALEGGRVAVEFDCAAPGGTRVAVEAGGRIAAGAA